MRLPTLLVLSTGLLAGIANAQEAQPLRLRLNADIRSLDPGVNRDANTDAVQNHLFEGLVAFREDASVGPLLAKSISVSEDGRTYTFVLRDDLHFSNGEPVGSDDVLFAWKRYTDPATGWRCLSEVDGRGAVKVTDVVAKDARTVAFTLAKPSALFLGTLARPDCGGTGIYHRSSLGPDGKWLTPVTTAPFKLGEWRRGQFIDLVSNDRYSALPGERDGLTGNKSTTLQKLRFAIIPDESTAKAALLAGNIDVNFDVQNADLAEYKANKDITLDSASVMNVNDILIQTRDPLLSDVRIRRALQLALDLPVLVDQVSEGTARPNNSPIPPASAYHGKLQAQPITRNLALARKLLAEAGYKGQPIRMITNKRYQSMFDQAVIAQAMAKEAGINLDLDVLEWGAQQDRYLAGSYQLMSHGFSARLDPSLSFEMFTGSKAEQPRKAWDNPEAQKLLAQSMEIADPEKRQAIMDRLEVMFREDVPMIVLYSEVRTSAVRSYVSGYRSWAMGQPRAWGVSIAR
ncbi:ABC transporter substrate-binding protein [Bosea sp. BIWAKO-01]|uniref:ABC transporter substrate-binding protein n=1 Tax=Bosea sp. BIWAKO-01 TaxID=506668 RepID=UPI0008530C6A|nr:ABC transporter substrate-binding protein [Bosea sp. BIWAKO-01]GAU85677.1 dipeptide-binding ABC transporter periplasmic substrate-binding component [Bosea sp. BIWAKO-01]